MPQIFLDYNGQVDKLVNEKDLIVNDRNFAVEMLTRYGYFSLIGGYKNIYINKSVRKYKRGTTFEDIVNLYKFDEELRSLFLKNILKFERKLHSVISYHFTQIYGEKQTFYLDRNNYNYIPQYRKGIDELIRKLNNLANGSTDYAYIKYHKGKYGKKCSSVGTYQCGYFGSSVPILYVFEAESAKQDQYRFSGFERKTVGTDFICDNKIQKCMCSWRAFVYIQDSRQHRRFVAAQKAEYSCQKKYISIRQK